MTATNYTVATNAQLLGGNLQKITCECDERAEKTREALENMDIASHSQIRCPSSDSLDSQETVSTDILDLYADPSETETVSSMDTAELIEAFPLPGSRVKRAGTPDIWLDTSVYSPANGEEERKSSLTEIYFSPVSVNGKRFELSSPLNSPLTTPTQESFDAARAPSKASDAEASDDGFALSTEQLDHLVRALVDSPMIQRRLWRRSCDACKTHPPNSRIEKLNPVTCSEDLQQRYERIFRHRLSVLRAPRATLCGLRLVDPNVDGSPVRKVSRRRRRDNRTDELEIDQCSHINTPQETSVEYSLNVLPGAKDAQSRVRFQIVNQVLGRTSGKLRYLLTANIDVTESFTKAALMELLHNSSQSAAARDTNLVESAIETFPNLHLDTCTMQTLTLISELDRIRSQFMDFYIVQVKATHDNGVPSRITVPWVSWGLNKALSQKDGEDLRHLMVGMVGKLASQEEASTAEIEWDGERRRVHCVPLVGGSEDRREVSWVCFARDGFDIGYW